MLLISFCVSSLVFCFLVTVSPSTYIEMCRTLFTQAHSKGTLMCPLLLKIKKMKTHGGQFYARQLLKNCLLLFAAGMCHKFIATFSHYRLYFILKSNCWFASGASGVEEQLHVWKRKRGWLVQEITTGTCCC